jgi:hypothetical protein
MLSAQSGRSVMLPGAGVGRRLWNGRGERFSRRRVERGSLSIPRAALLYGKVFVTSAIIRSITFICGVLGEIAVVLGPWIQVTPPISAAERVGLRPEIIPEHPRFSRGIHNGGSIIFGGNRWGGALPFQMSSGSLL